MLPCSHKPACSQCVHERALARVFAHVSCCCLLQLHARARVCRETLTNHRLVSIIKARIFANIYTYACNVRSSMSAARSLAYLCFGLLLLVRPLPHLFVFLIYGVCRVVPSPPCLSSLVSPCSCSVSFRGGRADGALKCADHKCCRLCTHSTVISCRQCSKWKGSQIA